MPRDPHSRLFLQYSEVPDVQFLVTLFCLLQPESVYGELAQESRKVEGESMPSLRLWRVETSRSAEFLD